MRGQKPRRAEAPRFWQLGRKPRDFKNKFNYFLFLLAQFLTIAMSNLRHPMNVAFIPNQDMIAFSFISQVCIVIVIFYQTACYSYNAIVTLMNCFDCELCIENKR